LTPVDPVLREAFLYWPAWDVLVQHVSRDRPRDACPQSVYGALMACEHDRLSALLYGNQIGETLQEATDVLDDLLLMAKDGTRPRFLVEMGLGLDVLGQ
jgi:hypothetical protein